MPKISFVKKLITCVLAGLVIGEAAFRQGYTYFRGWVPIRVWSAFPMAGILAGIIFAIVWQARKANRPAVLVFWQGLICYGVAFDLSEFGWAKICHRQFVMPGSMLDLPYRSFSASDLFWTFFSHSYLFGCIIGGLEILGAMLLLFRRTRLAGIFVLLPILANVLLMDIIYEVGAQVHAAIMMAGVLYFLVIEYKGLREFFFAAKNKLPALPLSGFLQWAIRLSIIYVPLLLIASAGHLDRYPRLTGKYEVKQHGIDQQVFERPDSANSPLTVVYFDVKNGCVFQFNSPLHRWNGHYSKQNDHLEIKWRSPAGTPTFSGTISDTTGGFVMHGMVGKDAVGVLLQKVDY